MLDVFFFIGTILAFLFVLIGAKTYSAWGYFIALILFIAMGIGLLTTGFDTYDNGAIIITDLNATVTQVTFSLLNYSADLSGNASSQIVYIIGLFYIVLGLIFSFLAIKQAADNKSAQM